MSRKRHDPSQLNPCQNCSQAFATPDMHDPIWAAMAELPEFDPLYFCSVECYLGAAKRFLRGRDWERARRALETYLGRTVVPFIRMLAAAPDIDEDQFNELSRKRWKPDNVEHMDTL